jgi:hypothetical protein
MLEKSVREPIEKDVHFYYITYILVNMSSKRNPFSFGWLVLVYVYNKLVTPFLSK